MHRGITGISGANSRYWKKQREVKKSRKKELTKLREDGILTKLSARTDGAKQDHTKTFQELEKRS